MDKDKIELSQILSICTGVLAFSLALVTFLAKVEDTPAYFFTIIYWLMIFFGAEAILVSLANVWGKFRKKVDIFLIVCFVVLFIVLLLLISSHIFPGITSFYSILENSHIFSFILSLLLGAVFIILFIVGPIVANFQWAKFRSELNSVFYKLRKKIERANLGAINFIVTISNDDLLAVGLVRETFKSAPYNMVIYRTMDILRNEILLVRENIVIITENKDILLDTIRKLEEKENRILGIIVIGFKIGEKEKLVFDSRGIQYEEFRHYTQRTVPIES